jgi:transcriptional regulator with XRE-family HTH domain
MAKTIGEQIKERRLAKGLTMQELANLTGLAAKQVIGDIESGRTSASVTTLNKIAAALDCKVSLKLIDK